MVNGHVIYVEGDPFLLTIPSYELFQRLVNRELIRMQEVVDSTLSYHNYVDSNGDSQITYHNGALPGAVGYYDKDFQAIVYMSDKSRVCCWRPALRPLTKDIELDQAFIHDTPDGQVFHGCCIHLDVGSLGLNKDVVPWELTDAKANDFYLDETPANGLHGEPFSWVSCDGWLVSRYPVARVTVDLLWQLGYIPTI